MVVNHVEMSHFLSVLLDFFVTIKTNLSDIYLSLLFSFIYLFIFINNILLLSFIYFYY